jgi:hypothetical protein
MSRGVDTILGLAGLGMVLYFVFSDAGATMSIINGAANVGSGFINTLEGRSYGGAPTSRGNYGAGGRATPTSFTPPINSGLVTRIR